MKGLYLTLDEGSLKKFEMNLYLKIPDVHNSVGKQLEQVGKMLIEESRAQVPVGTGSLVDSDYVSPVSITHEGVFIQIGYSNEDTTLVNPETGKLTSMYAVDVHEDLNVIHIIGNAKFLEYPLDARKKEFLEAMIAGVEVGLKR